MSASRMITNMIGVFGGGAVGRMLGGRMGGMIGSMAGSMLARNAGGGGLGSLLGGLMGGDDDSSQAAEAMPDDEAAVLIKAMCNAAKADGHVDDDEINDIIGRAGDLDADDERWLRAELRSPLDLDAFLREVPKGLEAEVYAASLLPIEVDTASEIEYLQRLGRGLGLTSAQINSIHEELGLR